MVVPIRLAKRTCAGLLIGPGVEGAVKISGTAYIMGRTVLYRESKFYGSCQIESDLQCGVQRRDGAEMEATETFGQARFGDGAGLFAQRHGILGQAAVVSFDFKLRRINSAFIFAARNRHHEYNRRNGIESVSADDDHGSGAALLGALGGTECRLIDVTAVHRWRENCLAAMRSASASLSANCWATSCDSSRYSASSAIPAKARSIALRSRAFR